MTVSVSAEVRDRDFAVDLQIPAGVTTAVLGANGSGKSTLLDVVAGLLRPDSGRAQVDDTVLFDLAQGRRRWAPPHRRPISLLAQDPLLFPHLRVRDNVAFGVRATGVGKRESRQVAQHWLTAVAAADLADRPARSLSGGQAQRVGLARALATNPRVLLLDEPLAALDVDTAAAMRGLLATVLPGRTSLIVTHSAIDATMLCDHAVVLVRGQVVATGTVAHVLARPTTAFVARLAGWNWLPGAVSGRTTMTTDSGDLIRCQTPHQLADGTRAIAIVRPESLRVVAAESDQAGGSSLVRQLCGIDPVGSRVLLRCDDLVVEIPLARMSGLRSPVGTSVTIGYDPADVVIYAADGPAPR